MRFQMAMRSALLAILALGSSSLLANGLAYGQSNQQATFGNYFNEFLGGCPTFGQRSQNALQMIADTYSMIRDLSTDPACTGLSQGQHPLLSSFYKLNLQVQRISIGKSKDKKILELQRKVEMLTLLSGAFPADLATASALAVARVELAAATLAVKDELSYAERLDKYSALPEVQGELANILTELPLLAQCTAKDPNKFLEVAGVFLPAISALGGASFGLATTAVGPIIHKFAKYLSQMRFSKSLKALTSVQGFAAINCALEAIQFDRCLNEDGLTLVESSPISQPGGQPYGSDPKSISRHNRWAGYNFLTVQIQEATEWIRKVQNGRPAQSNEDFIYQADTSSIRTFYENIKNYCASEIAASVNEVQRNNVVNQRGRGLTLLAKLLLAIYRGYAGSEFFAVPKINVFTLTLDESKLPYYLLNTPQQEFTKLFPPGLAPTTLEGLLSLEAARDLLPQNLVIEIKNRFENLLAGINLPPGVNEGTDAQLQIVLSQRRTDDPENLLIEAYDPHTDRKSPYEIFRSLKEWLAIIRDDHSSFKEAFRDDSADPNNPKALGPINFAGEANTVELISGLHDRLEHTIHYINSKYPLSNPLGGLTGQVVLSPDDRIGRIANELDIVKSRDTFIVQRLTNIVGLQLSAYLRE